MSADRPPEGVWPRSVLVTGAAGFIGSNLVRRLAAGGVSVTALDNLSRPGSRWIAEGLRRDVGDAMRFVEADLTDASAIEAASRDADAIVHLAGQTAVTRSIANPRRDFLDNCLGTVNVLEAARASDRDPIVLYASTNKVYGHLDHIATVEESDHHRFADLPEGVDESHPIHLVSPYACSKGAGEQYVLDYAETYGVRTVSFRQSCIYGDHQIGQEDQGWLAWFIIAIRSGRPITIFGDGKQVRDLLHVDDLLSCYEAALANIDRAAGQAFNVGGGRTRSLSIWWQLSRLLDEVLDEPMPTPGFAPARRGDQKIFVADSRKAQRELGWSPTISVEDGVRRLVEWYRQVDLPASP